MELRSALEQAREYPWIASDTPPWSLWAATHSTIADVLRHYDRATGPEDPRPRVPDLASLTTPELLTVQDGSLGMDVFEVLKERTGPENVRSLIAAARCESLHVIAADPAEDEDTQRTARSRTTVNPIKTLRRPRDTNATRRCGDDAARRSRSRPQRLKSPDTQPLASRPRSCVQRG